MSRVIITDNLKRFARSNAEVMDLALGRMAHDIVLVARMTVPFLHGQLFQAIQAERRSMLSHRVVVDSPYGAYQERGMRFDGSHLVLNYTTPNTNKDFLKNAGQKITDDALNYLKQAAQAAKAS